MNFLREHVSKEFVVLVICALKVVFGSVPFSDKRLNLRHIRKSSIMLMSKRSRFKERVVNLCVKFGNFRINFRRGGNDINDIVITVFLLVNIPISTVISF